MTDDLSDIVNVVNNAPTGWVRETGMVLVEASADRVVATLEVSERHHQGYGIVHGGVYCSVVETLASIGAALHASRHGSAVAGLENSTSFIRSVREGKVTATATPITRGRRSQLWQVEILTEDGKLVATGKVRLHVFQPDDDIAGEKPALRRG